jgi:hypothetical protein
MRQSLASLVAVWLQSLLASLVAVTSIATLASLVAVTSTASPLLDLDLSDKHDPRLQRSLRASEELRERSCVRGGASEELRQRSLVLEELS